MQLPEVRVEHLPLVIMTVGLVKGRVERVDGDVDCTTIGFKLQQIFHDVPCLPTQFTAVAVHVLEQVLLERVNHYIQLNFCSELAKSVAPIFLFLILVSHFWEEVLPEILRNRSIHKQRVEEIRKQIICFVESHNAVQVRVGTKRIRVLKFLEDILCVVSLLERDDEFAEVFDHWPVSDHIQKSLHVARGVHSQVLKFGKEFVLASFHEPLCVQICFLFSTFRHCGNPLPIISVGERKLDLIKTVALHELLVFCSS
mmetsp:Transcript_17928/g.34009  ORF Transcript_17928/g.34009 Transcript_17928/m.34009 type:complete len:256 (+) Transcript_17928:467-1234(+)